jgi:hypothetical protein
MEKKPHNLSWYSFQNWLAHLLAPLASAAEVRHTPKYVNPRMYWIHIIVQFNARKSAEYVDLVTYLGVFCLISDMFRTFVRKDSHQQMSYSIHVRAQRSSCTHGLQTAVTVCLIYCTSVQVAAPSDEKDPAGHCQSSIHIIISNISNDENCRLYLLGSLMQYTSLQHARNNVMALQRMSSEWAMVLCSQIKSNDIVCGVWLFDKIAAIFTCIKLPSTHLCADCVLVGMPVPPCPCCTLHTCTACQDPKID